MRRNVEPEWLDQLPAADLLAQGSRNDLCRINAWMGNAKILANQMQLARNDSTPRHVLDLGAGDGQFMAQVAARLPEGWRGTRLDLLDRQAVLAPEASLSFKNLGWSVRPVCGELPGWLLQVASQHWTIICANLFLHHFLENGLRQLLQVVSERTSFFVAVEPRRSLLALLASQLVALIGCNRVTRHDAIVSVRAGFTRGALTKLWGDKERWILEERAAGFFSHLFVAKRRHCRIPGTA